MTLSIITYLNRVLLGHGAIEEVGREAAALGMQRPFVVSDRGVADAGLVARLTSALDANRSGQFIDTPANPSEEAVRAGVAAYRSAGGDGILAIGGGSPLDLGKAIALASRVDGPLEDRAFYRGGPLSLNLQLPPVIAVPTTAGTGSEVSGGIALIFDSGRKAVIAGPALMPRVALLDPDLTLGLPAGLTAATGMDALAHCIETFLSNRTNPVADAIAIDGFRRGAGHLPVAVNEPGNANARREMMVASMQGAMAFQKGMGAVHALSHALGATGLHHGTLNALLLPPVIEFNRQAVPDRVAALEAAWPGGSRDIAKDLTSLCEEIGIPRSLREMGLAPGDRMEELVAQALDDPNSTTNPRPVTALAYRTILEAIWD